MRAILEEIVARKKQEVARARREVSPSTLFERVKASPPTRGFCRALQESEDVAVIAEVKKASPSAGVLRERFDPVALATAYQRNGARAVSVLTDAAFFKGSLEDLRRVSAAVSLPTLRKDFVLDAYQVVEARAAGADAVLLICKLLSDDQCRELLAAARELSLDCLVEVHTATELERALRLSAALVGINNRNLDTFEVDLQTTENLSKAVAGGVTLVSESGIRTRGDMERVAGCGIDAVLIGEALVRQPDPGAALAEFVGVRRWSE